MLLVEILNLIVDHTVNKNPLIHHEPVVITEGVVKNAILAADELGQKYLKLMGK